MAKTIAEWKKAFEDLYVAMCEDMEAKPLKTSVSIDIDEYATPPFGASAYRVRTRIDFD